jgi:uncharacterized protein
MSKIGEIVWRDLTVPNAAEVKDFYTRVVGWKAEDHPMGDYADYNIMPPESDEGITGICHARGSNASVPAQWLMYVQVDDVNAAAERCREAGGSVVDGPRKMGGQDFCVIKDPAGAVLALVS